MERRELGLTGIHLPVVGMGARQSFNVFGKEGQSSRRSLVDVALEEHANFFETSPEYGDADGILASSLTGRRNRAIVACGLTSSDLRLAHSQIDRSLRLFEERIDVLFVEHPSHWEAFEPVFSQMKSDGSLRAGGISCERAEDFPHLMDVLSNHSIDSIQIPYHPRVPDAARRLLPLAASMNVGVIVIQPFDGGSLLEGEMPADQFGRFASAGVKAPPQAILKWILSDNRVSSVIPGTRRVRHLRENLGIAEPPWLPPAERDRIAELFSSRSQPAE